MLGARASARVPRPAAGRASVGRRPGYAGAAARRRNHDDRRTRAHRPGALAQPLRLARARICTNWPTAAIRARWSRDWQRKSYGEENTFERDHRAGLARTEAHADRAWRGDRPPAARRRGARAHGNAQAQARAAARRRTLSADHAQLFVRRGRPTTARRSPTPRALLLAEVTAPAKRCVWPESRSIIWNASDRAHNSACSISGRSFAVAAPRLNRALDEVARRFGEEARHPRPGPSRARRAEPPDQVGESPDRAGRSSPTRDCRRSHPAIPIKM